MAELNAKYGHLALFFHDSVTGSRIGIVWKPSAFIPRKFKVSASKDMMPITDKLVIPNTFAIMSDISALGKGLVNNVIMQ